MFGVVSVSSESKKVVVAFAIPSDGLEFIGGNEKK